MARAGADQLLWFSYSLFAFFHEDLSFLSLSCSPAVELQLDSTVLDSHNRRIIKVGKGL